MGFVEHHRRGCLAPLFSCSEEDPEAMETKGAIIHRSPGAVCEARERRTSARTDGDELAGGGRTTASCEDAERARGSAEEREPVEGEQSVRLSRTPGGGSRTP